MGQAQISTPINLPQGFSVRPATMDDVEIIHNLFSATDILLYGEVESSVDDIQRNFSWPNFILEESSLLVFSPEGRLVGTGILYDEENPPVRNFISVRVHPDFADQGIEVSLFNWAFELAQRTIARCEPDVRIAVESNADENHHANLNALQAAGFTAIRHWWAMIIDRQENPPQVELPEGISIRPMNYPADLVDFARADIDAFRDHFGFVETPFEEELKIFTHWLENDPYFDPSLCFAAIDDASGDYAGVIFSRPMSRNKADYGHINSLAVVRAYRQRGVGLALLQTAFNEQWKRGKQRITLHVDASSLTGATRLYEKAGMYVDRRSISYDKEVRAGRDLRTTSVEE